MKKTGRLFAAIVFLLFAVPIPVAAASGTGVEEDYLDIWMEELDFSELDELLGDDLFPNESPLGREKIRFSVIVEELLTVGIKNFDYSLLIGWVKDALFYEFQTNRRLLIEIVLLAVGFSLLKNFSGAFREAYISEISFLMVYCILAVLLLKSFSIYREIAEAALNQSVDFMKVLVPTLSISMVFSTGTESAAGFYQIAFLVIYLVQWLFLKILLPLIQIYILLVLCNHFFEDEKFENLTELLKGVAGWAMKSAGLLVLGMNVVQSLIAPAKDRLVSGTVSRVASMIPGVGNALSGVGELLLGSGILIKNCVGVAALLFLLTLGMVPVLKLWGMSLLYKLAAAIVEPVADKRIAGCLKGMAEGGFLYLKLVIYCLVLLLVTIALATAASGLAR